MKKIILFLVVLMIAGTVSVFAEDADSGTPHIKPTFSFGFISAKEGKEDSETITALGLDVDFITGKGLTMGIQNILAWKKKVTMVNLNNFGLGYTYNAEKWSLGGKLMVIPNEFLDGGMGFNIGFNYWVAPDFGLTALMDIGFSMGDVKWSTFGLRFGISTKI